ncbi:MFS transporter [Helcococcus ovis]|uniref:MFS transporter n=1 Tax=Helcococcus ovis TaxID=72026 RepID=UPI0038BE001C
MKNNNKKNLYIGITTSVMGNKVFDLANNFMISKANPMSSSILAVYQSSELLVSVVLNLLGGAISDRTTKKNLIAIISDLLSGLFVLSILFLENTKWPLHYIIIPVNIMLSIISAFNAPASKSLIKHYINKNEVKNFNSVLQTSIQIIKVSTPIITLGLMKLIGYRGIILINAFTFFISAFVEFKLIGKSEIKKEESPNKNVLHNISEGIKYLFKKKQIFNLILTSAIVNFFLSGYNLFIPYSRNLYNVEFDPYVVFTTSEAIGGVLAGIVSFKLIKGNSSLKSYDFLIYSGLSIVGYFINLVFLRNIIIASSFILIFNLFLSIYNILFISAINDEVDSNYIGRVFAVVSTISLAFMPIGSMFFSFSFSASSGIQYLFIGLGVIITSWVFKNIYKNSSF